MQLHFPLDFSTLVGDVSFLNFGVINCLQWLPWRIKKMRGREVLNVLFKMLLTFHSVSLLNESYVLPAEEVQPMLSCEIFV